jgi:hypothetical protein
MVRRFLCLGAVLLVVLLVIPSCGGGGDTKPKSTVVDKAPAPPTPSPAGKGG